METQIKHKITDKVLMIITASDLSGANLRFANLRDADLRGAITDKRYFQAACIGSRKGTITYCFDDDEIWCGCFTGTLAEFEKKVAETHAEGTLHRKEYDGLITYIRSLM